MLITRRLSCFLSSHVPLQPIASGVACPPRPPDDRQPERLASMTQPRRRPELPAPGARKAARSRVELALARRALLPYYPADVVAALTSR